jgi:hypothetical protein
MRDVPKPAPQSLWAVLFCSAVGGAFAWAVYSPRPYGLAVGTQAVLPLVVLPAIFRHRRLGGFDAREKGYPKVAYAFLMPILALALRAALDWHILGWGRFWLPFAAVGAGLFLLVVGGAADVRKKALKMLVVAMLCLTYSYGLLVHLNCYYDGSWPATYRSQVVSHRLDSSGRGPTTYHLVVAPWLDTPGEHPVEVSRSVYAGHHNGDPVRVAVHAGRLGMPWYEVD